MVDANDSRYVRYHHAEVEVHSELAVPLVSKDRLIGTLDLESVEFDARRARLSCRGMRRSVRASRSSHRADRH